MILLVNGPNLNLLGEREPEVYGRTTLAEIEKMVRDACAGWNVEVKPFQSNSEGALIDFIHEHRKQARGIIINPGAYTHTSVALHDCLKSVTAPAVEVHISNLHAREEWRRKSVVAAACRGQITGLGVRGYILAAEWVCAEIGARPRP
jgi:3-dehydroquinate dehydratase II